MGFCPPSEKAIVVSGVEVALLAQPQVFQPEIFVCDEGLLVADLALPSFRQAQQSATKARHLWQAIDDNVDRVTLDALGGAASLVEGVEQTRTGALGRS
jgi:hypothetical protein